jgi:FkbM family methyltransferase
VAKIDSRLLFLIYKTYESVFHILYLLYRCLNFLTYGKNKRTSLSRAISPYFSIRTIWNKLFSQFGNKLFVMKNLDGRLMVIRFSLYDDVVALFGRIEEKKIENLFISQCKPGRVILDVGAHIGRYVLKASDYIGETGKIIACEPHPGNFSILLKNLTLNKCKNVILENAAMSAVQGYVYLCEGSDSGLHSIISHHKSDSCKGLQVKSNTIDALLREKSIEAVDFCKIDVEGAELFVLKGAEHTLSQKKVKRILCEIHPGVAIETIENLFRRYGYETKTISNFVYSFFPYKPRARMESPAFYLRKLQILQTDLEVPFSS